MRSWIYNLTIFLSLNKSSLQECDIVWIVVQNLKPHCRPLYPLLEVNSNLHRPDRWNLHRGNIRLKVLNLESTIQLSEVNLIQVASILDLNFSWVRSIRSSSYLDSRHINWCWEKESSIFVAGVGTGSPTSLA